VFRPLALLTLLVLTVPAFADPPPAEPEPPGATEILIDPPPTRRPGQDHWVSLNLTTLQPFTGRLGLKVWPRDNGSLWLEAYGGSVLFAAMYGFGARLQYTALGTEHGDRLMVAPGFGAHILPQYRTYDRVAYTDPFGNPVYYSDYRARSLTFLVADVDVSWMHDFSPNFGFEVGLKLGIAGRVGGQIGEDRVEWVMFGKNFYPVVSVFSGFRF
jgi:hypothetical protein